MYVEAKAWKIEIRLNDPFFLITVISLLLTRLEIKFPYLDFVSVIISENSWSNDSIIPIRLNKSKFVPLPLLVYYSNNFSIMRAGVRNELKREEERWTNNYLRKKKNM